MAFISITDQSSAVQSSQVLADPQPQSRPAAALQSVAVELHELVEHPRLILQRDPCKRNEYETKGTKFRWLSITCSAVNHFEAKKASDFLVHRFVLQLVDGTI